jgi:uncharacterized membrane protein (DUF373 family)
MSQALLTDPRAGAGNGETAHWPPRRVVHQDTPRTLRPLTWGQDFLQYAVAVVLIGAAVVVLFHSVYEAVFHAGEFTEQIPALIDSVLFVIIVLEIFSTVLSHFREGGFQLKPFLVIGIISAVRHILIVGAKSSLGGTVSHFNQTMIELGVNAGIVIVLVVALRLIRKRDFAEASE